MSLFLSASVHVKSYWAVFLAHVIAKFIPTLNADTITRSIGHADHPASFNQPELLLCSMQMSLLIATYCSLRSSLLPMWFASTVHCSLRFSLLSLFFSAPFCSYFFACCPSAPLGSFSFLFARAIFVHMRSSLFVFARLASSLLLASACPSLFFANIPAVWSFVYVPSHPAYLRFLVSFPFPGRWTEQWKRYTTYCWLEYVSVAFWYHMHTALVGCRQMMFGYSIRTDQGSKAGAEMFELCFKEMNDKSDLHVVVECDVCIDSQNPDMF